MNVKADKMRYQTNRLAHLLVLLGLAISILALFSIIIPTTVVPDFSIAVEILINIVLMLLTFLAAEKCKIYSLNWAIALFVIAGIHIARIFYVPTKLLIANMLSAGQFSLIVVYLVLSAGLLVLGGIITIQRHHILTKHLKEIGE
jgi:4-amino-4-deoxy-L-arabinose transferase-like glycosyltransferase